MPTYTYQCLNADCAELFDFFGPYEERETPRICPECGSEGRYRISAPMVMQAAYPDGMRRRSDSTWQKMKHVSELKVERARAFKKEDKERISQEIDKVSGRKRKPRKRIIDQL